MFEDTYEQITPDPATLEAGMTEFSNKNLGVGGAIIISAWITHKDEGAMTVLNVNKNNLWAPGLKHLAEALAHNQTLTELDISENSATESASVSSGDMSGIIALANAIPDMGALSVLSLKKNSLGQENDRGGMQALSDMLKVNTVLTDLDMSENYMDDTDAKIFSEGISDNGALQCTDGTPYQSKKSFMVSTHVCRHCGQHKTQHTSR